MKTQEILMDIVTEGSAGPSIQNVTIQDETKLNVNDNIFNDKFVVVSNYQFYDLIEKQAKEFEEFGKRMSLDLQNYYKEFFFRYDENIELKMNSVEVEIG